MRGKDPQLIPHRSRNFCILRVAFRIRVLNTQESPLMFSFKTSWVASFLGIVLVSIPGFTFNRRNSRAFAIVGQTIGQTNSAIVSAETSLASGVVLGRSLEYRSGDNRDPANAKAVPWRLASKKNCLGTRLRTDFLSCLVQQNGTMVAITRTPRCRSPQAPVFFTFTRTTNQSPT
jgi:hypothetical protein